MSTEAVTLFFALLSLLVVVGIVALLVDLVTPANLGIIDFVRPLSLELAAAIATTSMLGSLYLSEIANYSPCRLCWIQRYFMYPAAFLLIAAVFTKNQVLKWISFLLALCGLGVSSFHRYEQAAGHSGDFCDPLNPCSDVFVLEFGFVTIPTMAGIGFAGILAMILVNSRKVA